MAVVDSGEVRLAPSGGVWIGPLGVTEPDDVTTAMGTVDSDYGALGYITQDGVTLTPGVEMNDIMMWQSLFPVKRPITSVTFEISFTMGQLNRNTLGLYFFGGEFENDGGTGRLEFSSNPGTQERALVIEWVDDEGDHYRLVVPRASMTDREALALVRDEATTPGLTFSALDSNGITGYLLTDNADLIPPS